MPNCLHCEGHSKWKPPAGRAFEASPPSHAGILTSDDFTDFPHPSPWPEHMATCSEYFPSPFAAHAVNPRQIPYILKRVTDKGTQPGHPQSLVRLVAAKPPALLLETPPRGSQSSPRARGTASPRPPQTRRLLLARSRRPRSPPRSAMRLRPARRRPPLPARRRLLASCTSTGSKFPLPTRIPCILTILIPPHD